MDSAIEVKDALMLRHQLQLKKRLRLEFLASLSTLLRTYNISMDDALLDQLILATPDELTKGTQLTQNGTTNGGKAASSTQPGSNGANGNGILTAGVSSPESEMVSRVLESTPTATLFNVVLATNPEARVLNLVLSPPTMNVAQMAGPGPQIGPGPQPGDTGPGPQDGGGAGPGPQPGGGTGPGPQPGGGTGPGPQIGPAPQPDGGGGTGPGPQTGPQPGTP